MAAAARSCPLRQAAPRCARGGSPGCPLSAGPASALDRPGTTSKGTPARARASASSPPRPNTNGSPPFSRTTRSPRHASRMSSRSVALCGELPAASPLPTSTRRALAASAKTRGSTSASYRPPRPRAAAHGADRQQLGIAGTRADQGYQPNPVCRWPRRQTRALSVRSWPRPFGRRHGLQQLLQ